ncbi:hypothetical protein XAP6164_5560006 [Xanthomonas phaseoli pv. phaseoli]|nr:hypothetical protein XAP6164_5560006 [Xanthomonas phaseoli pv. phaseoli]
MRHFFQYLIRAFFILGNYCHKCSYATTRVLQGLLIILQFVWSVLYNLRSADSSPFASTKFVLSTL